jgi:hypothetical protein
MTVGLPAVDNSRIRALLVADLEQRRAWRAAARATQVSMLSISGAIGQVWPAKFNSGPW